MKQVIGLLLCIVIAVGCNKTKDDISGDSDVAGRIYIENIYDAEPAQLLPGQNIWVFDDTSTNAGSFLFSGKSDNDGNFTFSNLYSDRYYRIRSEKKQNTRLDQNVLFAVNQLQQPASNMKLVLRPDLSQQNALWITCTDTQPTPGRIPNDSIYVYTSRVLAALDSTFITGAGASYKFTANNDGTAFKMNLPTDSLFINAAITIGAVRLKHKITAVKLERTGIKELPITMRIQ